MKARQVPDPLQHVVFVLVVDHLLEEGQDLVLVLDVEVKSAELMDDSSDHKCHPLDYLIVHVLYHESLEERGDELLLYGLELEVL